MTIINTKKDLDTLKGTDKYVQFLDKLKGSLFNTRKDDELKKWVAAENNELIEQYGFTRADFEPIEQPVLPKYVFVDHEAQEKASEAKAYLSSTDWIVTKISELQLEGVDVEPLKVKYAAELAERKLMREVV